MTVAGYAFSEGYADTTPRCSVHHPDTSNSRCVDCGASLWFATYSSSTGTPGVFELRQGIAGTVPA